MNQHDYFYLPSLPFTLPRSPFQHKAPALATDRLATIVVRPHLLHTRNIEINRLRARSNTHSVDSIYFVLFTYLPHTRVTITAGCTSQLRSDGWAGPRSGPGSRKRRTAPLHWWLPFSGKATFGRLYKGGVRLLGRRYEVDAFEESERPDAFCSRCSGWKLIG